MSGFEDSEYDEAITTALADISFEDHVKYILRPPQQRHSVLLNTNFTPVRDSSPMPINTHSGMTSPAPSNEGGRRGSVRRSSIHGAPSDELLSTTAARMNDKAALEEKSRARSPSYLHVQELPQNSHLLSTTVSRVFEQNALEEQRTRKGSPQRGFKIATEDFQVSNSLLRPTESRKAELRAIEEAKKPASPNYKIPPPDFVPNSRLLKMTKERESDRLVLEEKKNGPKKVPGNGKKLSKDYTPGVHLVKPTQAIISFQNQRDKEKEDKRNAKDIWWEERRPAEKAKSRPNTPSKLRSPTKAFLNAKRDKAPISQSIFATPEEALAYNPPASIPPPPALAENSHLLKPTRAAEMSKIDAEMPPEFLPKPPSLELATRRSFCKPVDSKLFETTTAYEASKFGADLHPIEEVGPQEKVHSPSERLLRLNSNSAQRVREKAEKTPNPREEGWNPFAAKERSYPCPANRKRAGLHKHVSQERSNDSLSMISVGYDDGTIPSQSISRDDNDELDSSANFIESNEPVGTTNCRRSVSGSAVRTSQSKSSAAGGGLNKTSTTTPKKPISSLTATSTTKPKPKEVVAAEVVKKAINSIKEHTKEANPAPKHIIVPAKKPTASQSGILPPPALASTISNLPQSNNTTSSGDITSKIAAAELLARGILPVAVPPPAPVAAQKEEALAPPVTTLTNVMEEVEDQGGPEEKETISVKEEAIAAKAPKDETADESVEENGVSGSSLEKEESTTKAPEDETADESVEENGVSGSSLEKEESTTTSASNKNSKKKKKKNKNKK